VRSIRFALIPIAFCLAWCAREPATSNQGPGAQTGGSGSSEVLPCIAPIVSRSCATADCHDAVTKEHGMDLSTGEGIYDAWLGPTGTGRNGLDHCGNILRTRVTPGVPSESYVFMKVAGMLQCQGELSQPMPPPPAMALSSDEILAIRTWIENGATRDCSERDGGATPPNDGGGNSSIGGAGPAGGSSSGGTGATGGSDGGEGTGGSGAVDGGQEDAGDGGIVDPWVCTDTQPCTGGFLCVGYECGIEWSCETHYIEPDGGTLEHPCPPETATYCGCDGQTYEAQATCPTRPYRHAGDCGTGYDCDPLDDRCGGPAPTCPPGETASIDFDNCFSACVPSTSCRCEFVWECPQAQGYTCDTTTRFCVLAPPDGGT